MRAKDVPLSERINRGIRYLARVLNQDAGIPAVRPGDSSGCWTTAEGIQAVLGSPWIDEELRDHAKRMALFLLNSQLSKVSRGAWPLVAGGRLGSTMATAQAVEALQLARPLLDASSAEAAARSLALALTWLRDSQGEDGGWGVEPNGGSSGKTSRVVATFLALRALALDGYSVHSSHTIRRGVDWLWSVYEGEGFRPASGQPVAVCSTVRAIWAIRVCGASEERPELIERAIAFINGTRPSNLLWPVDTEAYVPDSAPGQIVFNNNTTAELLEFLVQVETDERSQLELVHWFQDHQRDDGSWCLGANDQVQPDLVTWPTNEAVIALNNFLRSARFQRLGTSTGASGQLPIPVPSPAGSQRFRSFLLWMFASLSIIEAVFLFGAPSYFMRSWQKLPVEYHRTFWWAAAVSVLLNILATGIVYLGRRLLRSQQTRRA